MWCVAHPRLRQPALGPAWGSTGRRHQPTHPTPHNSAHAPSPPPLPPPKQPRRRCVLPAYGAASYVPAIVLERTLYVRERADGLYLPITYLLAKMMDELMIAVRLR